jgi:hypothetical protein
VAHARMTLKEESKVIYNDVSARAMFQKGYDIRVVQGESLEAHDPHWHFQGP